jgi:hypothetical protein
MWRTSRRDREVGSISLLLLSLAGLLGCRQDMHDQPKLEPLERSPMFADGRGSRDPVDGTVAGSCAPTATFTRAAATPSSRAAIRRVSSSIPSRSR